MSEHTRDDELDAIEARLAVASAAPDLHFGLARLANDAIPALVARVRAAEAERDQLRGDVELLTGCAEAAEDAEAQMRDTLERRTASHARLSDALDLARMERAQAEDAETRADARLDRVRMLAEWFDAQPNWRDWGIGSQIRRAIDGPADDRP